MKAITDLVGADRPTAQQFDDNLSMATQKLKDACFKIVDEHLLRKKK